MKRFMYAVKWCSFDENADSNYGTYPKAFNSRKAAHDWLISEGFEKEKNTPQSLEYEYVKWGYPDFCIAGLIELEVVE